MCICFILINEDPTVFPYRICLASNRDEYFHRPSAPLNIWPSPDECIVGGRDLTAGKEGGTWLALNRSSGKIAAVLNIRDPVARQRRLLQPQYGRGSLVPEYLRSSLSAEEFCNNLAGKVDHYDPFLLVMLEPNSNGEYTLHCYANTGPEKYERLDVGKSTSCFGFSNTYPSRPLLKLKNGLQEFETVLLNQSNNCSNKSLIDSLYTLLSSSEPHLPDETLDWSFPPEYPRLFRDRLSCIFVKGYEKAYGTRAQSLLFVDFEGNVDFYEKDSIPPSMRPLPLDQDCEDLTEMHFKLTRETLPDVDSAREPYDV